MDTTSENELMTWIAYLCPLNLRHLVPPRRQIMPAPAPLDFKLSTSASWEAEVGKGQEWDWGRCFLE